MLDNDANCFVLGEAIRLKKKNVVGLTLGTGVGGGIVINGEKPSIKPVSNTTTLEACLNRVLSNFLKTALSKSFIILSLSAFSDNNAPNIPEINMLNPA